MAETVVGLRGAGVGILERKILKMFLIDQTMMFHVAHCCNGVAKR